MINAYNADAHANSKEKNRLQERSKGIARETYYKNNHDYLKLAYIKCMNNVSLFHTLL